MKIKTLFLILSIISLLLVLGYSYYNYEKNHELLLKNYKQEIQNNANEVRYNISSVMDEIMHKYYSNEKLHQKIYFQTLNKLLKNPDLNLEDIKKELALKYNDRVFNFYFINKNMTIYDSTFKSDIGLDFTNMPTVMPILNSVFTRKTFIDISQVILEDFSGNYTQYYLHRPKDKDYMFQMGVMFHKDKILHKYYKELEHIPTFNNYSLYSLTIDWNGQETIKRLSLEHNFKDKVETHLNDDKKDEFEVVYQKIFKEKMPLKIYEIEQKLQNELSKNSHQLGYLEIENKIYYQTMVLPIKHYQIFQDFSEIFQYLTIRFDVTEKYKEIESFKNQQIIFAIVYLIIVIILLYCVYKEILIPLYTLEKNMQNKTIVSEPKILNKQDEVGLMINTYNDLLDNLNKEIEKNQFLLNENKQFIADTVHQIRTPLSNIMMNGDMIKLYENDQKLSIFIDQINASINMLNHSYEDLAYITTFDTIEYSPSILSVSESLNKRVKFFHTISKVNKKEIVFTIEDDINLNINHIELERLIDNNISNAIKYAEINKPITISLQKENKKITLSFKSFGKPIKNTSKIFDKNFRENNGKRGLGLGLYMVQNICKKYNISYSITYENNQNIFSYSYIE